jgi:uncharacterized protein YbaR (Trm112 family)
MLSDELLRILRCPHCRGELRADERRDALTCAGCARRFDVRHGIPILIDPPANPHA